MLPMRNGTWPMAARRTMLPFIQAVHLHQLRLTDRDVQGDHVHPVQRLVEQAQEFDAPAAGKDPSIPIPFNWFFAHYDNAPPPGEFQVWFRYSVSAVGHAKVRVRLVVREFQFLLQVFHHRPRDTHLGDLFAQQYLQFAR
jgi:hypothetical protein